MIDKLGDNINSIVNSTIRELEEKYNINILFGSIIGSMSMNLSNNTSDIDFYLIFENKNYDEFKHNDNNNLINWLFPPDIDVASRYFIDNVNENKKYKIDFVCFDISRVLSSVRDYSVTNEKFPTYLYRNGISNDDGQFLIFRILSSPYLWDNKFYVKNNFKELKNTFVKVNILDYYFTRAKGNYENHIKSNDKVKLRKYLYTLHEVYCMKWILEHNTIPTIDFYELFKIYRCKNISSDINELLKINNEEKVYSKNVLEVKSNNEINSYLSYNLYEIENEIRRVSNNLEIDTLISLDENSELYNYII